MTRDLYRFVPSMLPADPRALPYVTNELLSDVLDRLNAMKPKSEKDIRREVATAAMQAILPVYAVANGGVGADHLPRNVAAHAVSMADALLAGLAK